MTKFNSRGELLIAAGKSILMQEKPKTVMVELLYEDANAIAMLTEDGFALADRVEEACREALNKSK